MKYFHQKGFAIGPILLAVVLLGVLAAVMVSATRSGSSDASKEISKVNAAAVMQQAMNMRDGYERMAVRGTAVDTITFDKTASTGLFHPTDGGSVTQTPPPDALATAGKSWKYKKTVKIQGIGLDANDDYVLVLPDVKLEICRQFNNLLYGDALTATPPTGAGTLANWEDDALGTDTAVDMSAVAAVDGKADYCIATSDSKYVFYKAISER